MMELGQTLHVTYNNQPHDKRDDWRDKELISNMEKEMLEPDETVHQLMSKIDKVCKLLSPVSTHIKSKDTGKNVNYKMLIKRQLCVSLP